MALLYILERFQYFVNDKRISGSVIYEKFTNNIRDKVKREWRKLESNSNFPKPTKFPDLQVVQDGDPTKEPMLTYADFFGYLPFWRKTSDAKWKSFIPKYYNFNTIKTRSGNVEIE